MNPRVDQLLLSLWYNDNDKLLFIIFTLEITIIHPETKLHHPLAIARTNVRHFDECQMDAYKILTNAISTHQHFDLL